MTLTVIVVAGLFFAGMGILALAAPARLVAPFGIAVAEPAARSEVRAVYGGFGLAVAAVLAVAVTSPDLRPGVLITVGAALAGMALGRVASAWDGPTAFYPNWFYCAVEAVGAAALFLVA